ncbi:uncharacterized protein LOC105844585 isoform X2 [Hydra vulgaris]|uniref:uncharacterized protein LOC105844585 isoform X2 n=1 Tax=Hydra vulgaris TaxID=6087 RepID=UPI000640F467|nr:uncharacterized protein LOC105844585 isoform X2 [Hydra vulgaris]
MFAKKSVNRLTFGVMVIGMVFAVLATEGKYWESYLFEKSISIYTGLWLFCGFQFSKENCIKRSINDPLRVVQSFMVMGCLGYLVSLLYVVRHYIKKKSNFKTLSVILNVTEKPKFGYT